MVNFDWTKFYRYMFTVRLPGEARQVLDYVMAKTVCQNIEELEFDIGNIAVKLGIARTSVSRGLMVLKGKGLIIVRPGQTNKQKRIIRLNFGEGNEKQG